MRRAVSASRAGLSNSAWRDCSAERAVLAGSVMRDCAALAANAQMLKRIEQHASRARATRGRGHTGYAGTAYRGPHPLTPSPSDERTVSLEQSGDGLESIHECFASRFARTLIACKYHKFNLRTAMATRP